MSQILKEAERPDREEDERYGDAQGDGLPEQLRTREGRASSDSWNRPMIMSATVAGTITGPGCELHHFYRLNHRFRDCSHSIIFGLPRLLDPQAARTAAALPLGGLAVRTTHRPAGTRTGMWRCYMLDTDD